MVRSPASICRKGISIVALLLAVFVARSAQADDPWVVFEGGEGAGEGKHIVLVSGDEEYRSEETLPQLGRILAQHHGFRCTVLFAVDPETGFIDPMNRGNIPGLEALDDADLMIIFTRYRNLPDDQMKHIVDYVDSGRPIIGMRTATHGFQIPDDSTYARYGIRSSEWEQGFGRQVLGETWIDHHGHHGHESSRGIVVESMRDHPIVKDIADGDIWGPTDVYTVRLPLPETCSPVVLGQVLTGMNADDEPLEGEKNDPMMPVAWTNTFTTESGVDARVFCTTMGASQDFASEGLRRLMVNASYWCLGMEDEIPESSVVDIVGEYAPTRYRFNGHRREVKPSDHALEE